MKKLIGCSTLAALIAASGVAFADTAETKGGIKIKTEDGRFEVSVGGRIHFDGYLLDEDSDPGAVIGAFGSQAGGQQERGGFAFRRAYLTLTGKLYGWKYKFENDFAVSGGSPGSFREMWIATTLGPGEVVIGQFKPFRGMEELTSSNDITMMERPWTSSTGLFAGRQFLMGLGYKGLIADSFGYGVHAMNLGGANTTTEGMTYGGRGYWVPMSADGNVLHLGLSASIDDQDTGSATANTSVPYGGRRGPTLNLGTAGAGAGASVDNSQTTVGLEAAWGFGPFALQAEYAVAALDNTHTVAGAQEDSDVQAYYLQAGWFVTGEQVTYKKDRGAFGKPKPINESGAWEVTARYDAAENKDQSATANPCGLNVAASGSAPALTANSCEAQTLTLGVNWYVNPNVRFMLNYYIGEADRGTIDPATGASVNETDEPQAISLRTQLSF